MLKRPLPELALEAGDLGTVVLVHDDGRAFDVEFLNANSDSLGMVTLTRDAIAPGDER